MNKKTLLLSALLGFAVLPFVASAQGGGGATLEGMASAFDTAIATVGGSIVFIGWIITGILYLTAGGAPEKTGVAKKAVVACTIGTVIVILAGASSAITDVIKSAFGL
jgi:hypothetical protein